MTTTVVPRSYRDKWQSPNDPVWHDFHRNYWGAASRGKPIVDDVLRQPPPNRFLDIWPASVLERFGVLSFTGTGNSFLVRDELLLFAQRFWDARDRPEESIDGVVLFGQSGIGKTVLLVFFLVQCLSRGEPVLFTTYNRKTYLFDEWGVLATRPSQFIAFTHLPCRADHAPRLWSLVDCPVEQSPQPLSVTLGARSHAFFIMTVAPDNLHFMYFENEPSVRAWWMSRWSDNELIALLRPSRGPTREHLQRFGTPDAAAVRALCAGAGPIPRDIVRLLRDPWVHIGLVAEQMAYGSLLPVLALVLVLGIEPFFNEFCDSLTFVGRAPGPPRTGLDSDNDAYEVGFKTRAAADAVMDRLASFSACDRRYLLKLKRCMALPPRAEPIRPRYPGPRGAATVTRHPRPGFAGFLFECLARQYVYAPFDLDEGAGAGCEGAQAIASRSPNTALSPLVRELGGFPVPPHHHQFARMVPAPCTGSSSSGAARMVFKAPQVDAEASARRTTVVIDKRRGITWRANSSSPGPHQNPSESTVAPPQSTSIPLSEPVPWGARASVPATLADIGLGELPLDAVLRCARKVVLWAVQIASDRGREDGDEDEDEGGFAMVRRLCERAREALPGAVVVVKYALVVPHDAAWGSAFDVEWELGDGFWGNEGEAYVQFVDTCGVCRVEDVFGVPVPTASS
ncbi:hypothetical protein GSI_12417 [Ganoderma sinense ZZ0214-1]|uniref:Uncharacterized protein n=1 Tax=Ganoderma sinense ZZ0214-1 TaxID=1077348 RepID=A0A2G8RVG3_9APHY|nr:hypothetical protein GSI_12417 [Ganoderma sinense ZZ0214-1]